MQTRQVAISFAYLTLLVVIKDGNTPLHRACMKGYVAVVEQLIERGVNIEARNKVHNPTAEPT